MKSFIILILMLPLVITAFGQTAIINDIDGFVNVRAEANKNAEVIYQLHESEVFLYESTTKDWWKVHIAKSKYSLGQAENQYITGYVHKSRIFPLGEMKLYLESELNFSYNIKSFNKDNKIIDFKEGKWVTHINGMLPWGIDGNHPKREVIAIDLQINDKKISVPKVLFADLYECDNDFKVYKVSNMYFLEQWNSDGAGGYLLVWVINKEGVQQRLLYNDF